MRQLHLTHRLLLSLATIALLTPQITRAEAGPFVGVRAGGHYTDSERHYFIADEVYDYRNETYAFGLQLGHRFDNRFALRTYYDRLRTSIEGYESSGSGHSYGADILFYLASPVYFGVGANSTRYHHEKDRFWRATLGFEAPLRDRFALRFEVAMQSNNEFSEPFAGISLNYRLDRDMNKQILPRTFRERRAHRQQKAQTSTLPEQPENPPANLHRSTPPPAGSNPNEPASESLLEQLEDNFAVFFSFNSAELTEASYASVEALAQLLREHNEAQIEIQGHTDLTGNEKYNVWLSQQRAEAVAALLTDEYGIDSERIETIGLGMQQPLIDAIAPEANASNRRIEVVFRNNRQRLVLAAPQPEH